MLSLSNLAVARGGVTVLRGLTLSVGPGQALILRGPNGSGKTTLLRTLAGLQPPAGGGFDLPPDSVAYAAHADGLKSTLTVAENLSFWSRIYGGPGIDQALTALNLTQLTRRRAGELSAGQKRRLGLARLLVTGRPVWLLDEPTVSLDVASVALFADVVRAHLKTGGLAVIATHVDLGLPEATVLDLDPHRAREIQSTGFDEAFT
ncbi:MAG: heme ABC exporter ATP-binding protein CcmA [Tabrizicola sp.]|jgi:heme exporter protein A|uniref:heme ABC exporter ATP-binding protein CcmA n=1 Tax=Tabrizicola sp. TaxID=2005166 RepID=UPI001B5FA351|nr:heme ABC exporter ATP-binding protein CcmA [Tabrizicola sp.]MCC6518512.1 heme ABC exporter ATP-binding protein CcmA [Tabrizicola sp.]